MNVRALSSVDSLVVIGDVESFGAPMTISHDGEFVQVTIAPHFKPAATYCKAVPRIQSRQNPEWYGAEIARTVAEVAGLVSSPSLVAWLLDCGFVLNV